MQIYESVILSLLIIYSNLKDEQQYSIKKLRVYYIVCKSILVVSDEHMDITFPFTPTKSSIELSMSKHWAWEVKSDPFIALTLALNIKLTFCCNYIQNYLVDCKTEGQSYWELPSHNCKWKFI